MDGPSLTTFAQFVSRSVALAVDRTAGFFGWNTRTVAAATVVVVGYILLFAAKGPVPARDDLEKTIIKTIIPLALVVSGLFLINLLLAPYRIYQASASTSSKAIAVQESHIQEVTAANERLRQAIEMKRHYFDVTEPAYENAWAITMAFWEWRKSLGTEPGMLLVTADKDDAARRLAGAFTQFAVRGSSFGNGNLQNIGIKPEQTDDIEQAASVNGTLVIHALPTVKGVLPLIDRIAEKVIRVERSYKMPATPSPLTPNVLWLHFGKGVRWSSEYWDERKKAKSQ